MWNTQSKCRFASGKPQRNREQQRSMKEATLLSNVAFFYAGNDLHFHTLSRAVPSALRGLTSVFGMGTGGSPAV